MIPIRDNIPYKSIPFVSWGIIGVCLGVFLGMKLLPFETQRYLTHLYGMVPIRYSNPDWAVAYGLPPDGYLSFITNLFLHGGWLHIILNMWFIWIFSKSIENRMGSARFFVFYLLCGLIATSLQFYFDPKMVFPVVGASGAIAGVLGAYFFLYPYARVVVWFPLFFLPLFFELPAIAFLGFWGIMQIYKAMTPLVFEGITTDVAWWAHLGGFLAGAFLHPLFVKNQEEEEG